MDFVKVTQTEMEDMGFIAEKLLPDGIISYYAVEEDGIRKGYLQTEEDDDELHLQMLFVPHKYREMGYLDIKGKSKLIGTIDLPQPERIRKINHAQKLWELLAEKDKETDGKYDLVGRMKDLIQDHLYTISSEEISFYSGRTRTNSNKEFKAKKRKYKSSEYRDRIETLAERLTLKRDKKTNEFTPNSDFDMLWSNTLIRGEDHFMREGGMDFIKIFNELLEKVEINELNAKDAKKLSFKDFAVEFMLCGMQNDLLGDGKKGEEAFLAYDDQKYVEGIVDNSKIYLRNKKLLERLKPRCNDTCPGEEERR